MTTAVGDLASFSYFDHAATTPMHPDAVEAMLPFLRDRFGNPSGAHALARDARRAVDEARDTMAEAFGCEPGEIVFCGGGTEADNLAVRGVAEAVGITRPGDYPGALVCSAIEHHAVLHPVEHLGGHTVAVGPNGLVDLDALADALHLGVRLVSIVLANNEIGTVQDLAAIAAVVRERAPEAVLHTDAVQGVTWLDLATCASDADLLSISAHKFGGPKGVGVLLARDGVPLAPQLLGGGQEREQRSGTHNVAGIVAMAAATRAAVDSRKAVVDRIAARRDRLADDLLRTVPDTVETAVVDGDRTHKVAGNCHVCFARIESEALLFLLEKEGILASAASSCASGAQEPSHVLTALGVPRPLALGSLRLSLGATTTEADVDRALEVIPAAVERLRRLGS